VPVSVNPKSVSTCRCSAIRHGRAIGDRIDPRPAAATVIVIVEYRNLIPSVVINISLDLAASE
jgi:hypothetical protein